jgi:hypothetical protein
LNRLVGSIFVVWVLSPDAYLFAAEFRAPAYSLIQEWPTIK